VKHTLNGPYTYCDVILSDACFGIARGDKLSMEFIIDFYLYKVTFTSGRTAVIYHGFNPNIDDKDTTVFQPCALKNGFSSCKQRQFNNGGYELVARRDEESLIIHVTISGGSKGKEESISFLNNVRACKRVNHSITCSP
jgi:hypothetical protein